LQGEIHSVHTVRGDELKALRELNRNWPSFTGERARSNVAKKIEAAGAGCLTGIGLKRVSRFGTRNFAGERRGGA
jgi:hypothetical protein